MCIRDRLFTVAASDAVRIMDGWRERFPSTRISCIGRVTPGPGIQLRDKTGIRQMPPAGYEHFRGES